MLQNFRVVILAAGQGKRMGAEIPKVLVPIGGRPMIDHLLDSVEGSGIENKPVVVVGHGADLVMKHLGEQCEFAIQNEQLGTAHALQCALPLVGDSGRVLVLYGDHAFVSAATIEKLVNHCTASIAPVVLMTVQVGNFNDWRKAFYDFGRIVRDENGVVKKIVEKRDASEAELAITEVNPGYYCFDIAWVKQNINKIKNQNAQSEYYLTDLIALAINQGEKVEAITVDDPREGLGVNTKEQLEMAERAMGNIL
jgi:bifunctional UDP-N-acetylglucosamine pyrophosphorylase/glucosamine-1-phosphate N-acetyltransferase